MSAIEQIDFTQQIAYSAPVYRMHNPRWAWAPLSGEGAKRYGGRFNPEGKSALYTSTDMLTAYEEVTDAGITPGLTKPLILVSYQATLDQVVDLTGYRTLFKQNWEILADLHSRKSGNMPLGWQAFLAAKKAKAQAILVPSYRRNGGINLVFIRWNNQTLQLHDPDDRLKAVYGEKLTRS